ncbi:hypothetical protein O181_036080 [Austropuccinia psidii MF-1]|uniref:Uncharacterized protein n=1 Tax=Austropuccinia psidii MF-1 TaxID=1389203 RepID=A0A9Q3D5V5_9BASI|nr:hypothetical protein [Austropuccinia psidii MF-1]
MSSLCRKVSENYTTNILGFLRMSHTFAPAPTSAQVNAHAPTTAQAPSPAPTLADAQESTTTPEPPANVQLNFTLGRHMLFLCVHVSHPCTEGIVWQASPVSPTKCQSH